MGSKKKIIDSFKKINGQWTFFVKVKTFFYKYFIQPFVILKNSKKKVRFLEIGPGYDRIENFEALNIIKTHNTDYIADISIERLPFKDNSFDLVYMSHILEHTFWYDIDNVIEKIKNIIKVGGVLEIWVPDGKKIAQAFVDAENGINDNFKDDKWFRLNENKDPCLWYCGRTFSYGDGIRGGGGINSRGHWNLHLSAFSSRFLIELLKRHGFQDTCQMQSNEFRGKGHQFINLGVRGIKSGISESAILK